MAAATIAAMPTHGGLDDEQRQKLCEAAVTLDGAPARISGWANSFAAVARTDGRGGVVDFAWATAAHIVANKNGAFQS